MHPLRFFRHHTGLKPIGLWCEEVGDGVCPECNRMDSPLHRQQDSKEIRCADCVVICQAYPIFEKTTRFRLAAGCYALVTPSHSVFYTSRCVDEVSKKITRVSGKVTPFIRQTMLSPPESDWMFVTFAKKSITENMHVNRNNEQIKFSGSTMLGAKFLDTAQRRRIAEIVQKYPEMTSDEWTDLIVGRVKVDSMSESQANKKRFRKALDKIFLKHPALENDEPLPPLGSSDANLLIMMGIEK